MGRILGIDYGSHRVGIAVSDPSRTISQPLMTLINDDQLMKRLLEIIDSYEVEELVVGEPRTLKGELGQSAEEVHEFVFKIRESCGIPVKLWDERLTSVQARLSMLQMGLKKKQRAQKATVDKVAAALLLQNYLDALQMAEDPSSNNESAKHE